MVVVLAALLAGCETEAPDGLVQRGQEVQGLLKTVKDASSCGHLALKLRHVALATTPRDVFLKDRDRVMGEIERAGCLVAPAEK